MASILERLTEGTQFADKKKETAALLSKWEKSGLLEGINDDHQRSSMAVLLENQAKELLREANTMASGDVQGFASVAFPIVRRVFAGLIANDLVSVQPMSLPNGLVFFMDFRHGTQLGLDDDKVVAARTESVYGDRVGQEVRQGVRVNGNDFAEKGFYSLTSGYGTARVSAGVSGSVFVAAADAAAAEDAGALVRFDPDVEAEGAKKVVVFRAAVSALPAAWSLVAEQDLTSLSMVSGTVSAYVQPNDPLQTVTGGAAVTLNSQEAKLVRRLTRVVEGAGKLAAQDTVGTKYLEVVVLSTSALAYGAGDTMDDGGADKLVIQFPIKDQLQAAGTDGGLGALAAASPWALENTPQISEIELKVDSFSITARSRKLKAAWTPELGQDLNAYHNLDAEVELTSMLSEQIGLEIDQEILNDLIKGATGGVKYWSRRPGNFVNRLTGAPLATDSTSAVLPPDFTGNVSMWYETLLETINDVSADIHRKTLRGAANFIVVSPEVANILEFTAGFRATVTHDSDKGSTGAVKVGALNSKFDVIVDPYFPRNVILVGRKGSSFLESGYVYAPYVPLQTTPTIFDPNTFTPRKAVMTRYGKAFVRPDMYN